MDAVILTNKLLKAKIDLSPFELSSLIFKGQEYIYQKNDGWLKSWPICFPITGKLFNEKYYYKGKEYYMSNHGFFRDINDWKKTKVQENQIVLSHTNMNNFSNYPFSFRLEVSYKLVVNKLINEITITNLSTNSMPYYFGWHPAFLINHESGQLKFDSAQTFSSVPLDSYLRETMSQFTEQNINLSQLDFNQGKSYVALNQTSKQVEIKDDTKTLVLITENYENIVLWKNDNFSNYICVEPWMGHQDYYNEPYNDIFLKPWVKVLARNDKKTYKMEIKLLK